MHACIGAISQNIPAVSIAYSNKFAGVMQTVGLEHLVVDPRRMDESEITQIVDQLYDRRTTIRDEIERRMPVVKRSIRNALCDLNGCVDDQH